MFEVTDELVINVNEISSVVVSVDTTTDTDFRGDPIQDEKGKYITKLVPCLNISMTNGDKHVVGGLENIYNFLISESKTKMWHSLYKKINKYLSDEDKYYVFYLSDEDNIIYKECQ